MADADAETEPAGGVDLVVASLTYNRPDGLAKLLDAFETLAAPERTLFLIVDNAPDGNARAAVEAVGARASFDLRYVHEPIPGISAGRNRALAEALALRARRLAFIDDDEWPSAEWLSQLLQMQARTGAAAVVGPVLGHLPSGAPAWMERGGFFRFSGPEDGAEMETAATNNALIALDWVEKTKVRFDPSFGLSGGEDTMFFLQLRMAGARIVFARNALVHETVTPERTRLSWLFRRWRRGGNGQARINMILGGEPRWRVALGGLVRLAAGGVAALAAAPAALFGRFEVPAYGLMILCRGVGRIGAACGEVVSEYERGPRQDLPRAPVQN